MATRAASRNAMKRSSHRRGFALIDVIVGGMLLAIGLSAVISLTTRSLRMQTDGERQMTASWLADELLNMVLVEGPASYTRLYDTSGRYDAPFENFSYDLLIEDQGVNQPFRVTATVSWDGAQDVRQVQVQTLISERGGDPNQPRAPFEPVDREDRWYEIENER